MSALGEVKIRVPASVARGSIARARALVIHPNERVERKDGKSVDRNYRFVNRVVVSYAGRDVAEFDTSTSIGENPSFGFAFRANEPGTLKVTFFDTHGGRFEGAAEVKVFAQADPSEKATLAVQATAPAAGYIGGARVGWTQTASGQAELLARLEQAQR